MTTLCTPQAPACARGRLHSHGQYYFAQEVEFTMDRDLESILHDVRELDRESQLELASRILGDNQSDSEIDAAHRREVRSRLEAYRHGDLKADDIEPMFERARKMIADARNR